MPQTYAVSNAISYARKACEDGTARLLREAAKLTPAEVGHEVGTSRQIISSYEQKKVVPGPKIGFNYGLYLKHLARKYPEAIPYQRLTAPLPTKSNASQAADVAKSSAGTAHAQD
jgi:transcriptional regulator with XRE-family HTH domain